MTSEYVLSRCEVCGSERVQAIQPQRNLVYWRCNACRHCSLLLDPAESSESFETAQVQYFGFDSALLRGEIGPSDRDLIRVRERTLLRFLPSKANVVEVGPGAGHVLRILKSKGFAVAAVEHSPVLARGISDSLSVPVFIGEWETADLADGSFDAVCSFHVVEHVKDPIAHLLKAFQVVRSGGLAFIATPNAGSLQHIFAESLSPNFDSAHRVLFSRQSLIDCCRKVGWELVQCSTPEVPSGWARVATKALRRLRGEDEQATAGQYVGNGLRFNAMYQAFRILTVPLRFFQQLMGFGNEVFLVLRKP